MTGPQLVQAGSEVRSPAASSGEVAQILQQRDRLSYSVGRLVAMSASTCCQSAGSCPTSRSMCWARATAASACDVPVFRYALDRWPADVFRLETSATVLQTEPLATEFRNLTGNSGLNLETAVSTNGTKLFFPLHVKRAEAPIWQGELTPATYAGLASVMIAIVFLYSLSAIFIFGGEFNAALMRAGALAKTGVEEDPATKSF